MPAKKETCRIAFLTCDEQPEPRPSDCLISDALAQHDVESVFAPWQAEMQLFDGCVAALPRSSWDYYLHPQEFLSKLEAFAVRGIRVINPLPVIKANMHKRYLLDYSKAALTPPPTRLCAQVDAAVLLECADAFATRRLIIKPIVGAAGWKCRLCDVDDPEDLARVSAACAADGPWLVQAFVEAIKQGETSCIFFGGTFSHAVLKVPHSDEIRCQREHGGQYRLVEVDSSILGACCEIVAKLDNKAAYVRIDCILAPERPYLMEIEMIEPDLYLDLAPVAAKRFAAVIAQDLAHSRE